MSRFIRTSCWAIILLAYLALSASSCSKTRQKDVHVMSKSAMSDNSRQQGKDFQNKLENMCSIAEQEGLPHDCLRPEQTSNSWGFHFIHHWKHILSSKIFGLRECKSGTVYSHEAEGGEWQLAVTLNVFECSSLSHPKVEDIECGMRLVLTPKDYIKIWAFCVRFYYPDSSFVDVRLQRAEHPVYQPIFKMSCERATTFTFPSDCSFSGDIRSNRYFDMYFT